MSTAPGGVKCSSLATGDLFFERNRAEVNRNRAQKCDPKNGSAVLSVKKGWIHVFPPERKTHDRQET